MSKRSRDKGKRGERAVIDALQPVLDTICSELGIKPVLLQRNTVQSDAGGTDICGLDWLAAEVKNCEAQGPGALDDWWNQTVQQSEQWPRANGAKRVPVLFYMRNRQPMRVRMRGVLFDAGCAEWQDCEPVDISLNQFLPWFIKVCKVELSANPKTNK